MKKSLIDLTKTNNPRIIEIISMYIANIDGLEEAEGYKKVNDILRLIRNGGSQETNWREKLIKEGKIKNGYVQKDNFVQLNKLEEIIMLALFSDIKNSITSDTGELVSKKIEPFAPIFDDELKAIGRRIMEMGQNNNRGGLPRLNKGNNDENRKMYNDELNKLVTQMVKRIIDNYEEYQEFIFRCSERINLDEVHTLLNSYYQQNIGLLQSYYLKHVSVTPTL